MRIEVEFRCISTPLVRGLGGIWGANGERAPNGSKAHGMPAEAGALGPPFFEAS